MMKMERRLRHSVVGALVWMERSTFVFIGVLLFAVALTLLLRSAATLGELVTVPHAQAIVVGNHILDSILFVLILVELAYTVVLSLRGATLLAEPFLIVGLIAVIRRVLVITVGEVEGVPGPTTGTFSSNGTELLVLTVVVVAFVFAIWLLRRSGDRVPATMEMPPENEPSTTNIVDGKETAESRVRLVDR
jgi:uncharacterized membrane protein (DUF373 family)